MKSTPHSECCKLFIGQISDASERHTVIHLSTGEYSRTVRDDVDGRTAMFLLITSHKLNVQLIQIVHALDDRSVAFQHRVLPVC